jgi:hypothetical protein
MAATRAAGTEARSISAHSGGLESKKTSGRGEVFFLDFPLYRTPHDEAQASGKQREECGGTTMGTEIPGIQLHESQTTETALGAESGGTIQRAS